MLIIDHILINSKKTIRGCLKPWFCSCSWCTLAIVYSLKITLFKKEVYLFIFSS